MIGLLLSVAGLHSTDSGAVELAAGLDEAEALIQDGEWGVARARLLELVDAHAGEPTVFVERPRIVRALERATFWDGRERPTLETLIDGKIVTYRERRAWIELAYDSFRGDDFERPEGEIDEFHRVTFDGEVEVDWRGDDLRRPPAIWVELAPSDVLRSGIVSRRGNEEGTPYLVELSRVDDGFLRGLRTLDAVDAKRLEEGDSWRLGLEVDGDRLQASLDRRRALRFDVPPSSALRLGFERVPFEQLRIEGRVSRSWLRSELDRELHEQWTEFRARTDVEDELPRALRHESLRSFGAALFASDELPGPERARQQELMTTAIERASAGEGEAALAEARALDVGRTTEVFRRWLLGYLLITLGRHADARSHLDFVVTEDPSFGPVWLARGIAHAELEMHAAAIDDYEVALERTRQDGWIYHQLAGEQLASGRLDDVAATCLRAAEGRRYGQELDDVNALRIKAQTGPSWQEAFEERTDHYHVTSNIDRRTCVDAARILEVAFERFSGALRPVELEDGAEFRVYLFDGENGYQRYVSDLFGQRRENTAGLYSPMLDQLLIWNLPDREAMLRTVRHEGFHQYFSQLVRDPPVWLNEGLAEYWEAADFTKSRSKMVPVRREYLGAFTGMFAFNRTRLTTFVALDPASFYANAEVTYGLAWSFVYFLLHSTRENQALFDELIDRLAAGESGRVATEAVFGDRLGPLDVRMGQFMKELAE